MLEFILMQIIVFKKNEKFKNKVGNFSLND